LLRTLSGLNLPKLGNFELINVPEKDERIKNSISTLRYSKLEFFRLKHDGGKLANIGEYTQPLRLLADSSEIEQFSIWNWIVNSEQVTQIISSAKSSNWICLHQCQLLLDDEIDFGDTLDESELELLDLGYSGGPRYSDFKSNPHRLENFLKALGKSLRVRQNLKEISLYNSGLDRKTVEQMLKDSQLDNCKIFYI
jgi:hypothetical protein